MFDLKVLRDTVNRYRTKTLFLETNTLEVYGDGTVVKPIFTTEDFDKEEYLSFKRLYVEIGDPTEYRQAKILLGSVEHWDNLKKCDWFTPLITACRKELANKLESEAFARIMSEGLAAKESGTRLQAFKTILREVQMINEAGTGKAASKRGRPSKDEIDANLKKLSEEERRVQKDYERIGQTPKEDRKPEKERFEQGGTDYLQ